MFNQPIFRDLKLNRFQNVALSRFLLQTSYPSWRQTTSQSTGWIRHRKHKSSNIRNANKISDNRMACCVPRGIDSLESCWSRCAGLEAFVCFSSAVAGRCWVLLIIFSCFISARDLITTPAGLPREAGLGADLDASFWASVTAATTTNYKEYEWNEHRKNQQLYYNWLHSV